MAGMSLLVPVAMWLVINVGWRGTYVFLGIAVVVFMVPLALWVVRESPESIGLTPDGLPREPAAPGVSMVERTDVADAAHRPCHLKGVTPWATRRSSTRAAGPWRRSR